MSPGAQLPRLMANDVRALLPAWIACVLTATIAGLTRSEIHQFSQFAFCTAMSALGAQSIGHEYANRTLDLMLTLPVGRRRLLLGKLAVVGAMVVPLAAYAWQLGLLVDLPVLTPWLVPAVALCLAPTLTMLCRNQLAGTIFSMSLPSVVFIVVLIVTRTTLDITDADEAAVTTWSRLMVPVLVGGAVLGWRLFMRLESIEGGARGIEPKWRTATSAEVSPTHPWWQLMKKEFRLQHMTFAITAMYLAACGAAQLFHLPGPSHNVSFIGAASIIYAIGLPFLVGSLATAEERQLGTLAWQLQLPVPAAQQWAAKAVMVFGLAWLLSNALPNLLVRTFWPTEGAFVDQSIVFVILVTALSMYVSSLCDTAVRAVVTSVVAFAFGMWLLLASKLLIGLERGAVALLCVVAATLVGFAFLNHRAERPAAPRVWRQTLSVAALLAFGIVIVRAVNL